MQAYIREEDIFRFSYVAVFGIILKFTSCINYWFQLNDPPVPEDQQAQDNSQAVVPKDNRVVRDDPSTSALESERVGHL